MSRPRTCDCGECRKCKHREYMRRWYAANASTARSTATASRNRRIEEVRAYDRARGFRVYDILKSKARRAVSHAVATGRLIRQECEVCGGHAEAHHDDYSRPLEVRWLCKTHHMELHRKVAA